MRSFVPCLLLAFAAPSAHAAASYDGCAGFIDSVPATITSQGVWCLRKDLSTASASGIAIIVEVNNVTIDCNGFKLGGLGAGPTTQAKGIGASDRFNTTIRDCNIRGFKTGIDLQFSTGARVLDSILEANTTIGIAVDGDGTMIRGNRVVDTAGDTEPSVYGIFARGSADIIDNTVVGVEGTNAQGIYASYNYGGVIAGNRVRGIVGPNVANGIRAFSNGYVAIRDNAVLGPGFTAISCSNDQGTARDNVIAGFTTAVLTCVASGNTVNPN